MPDFEVFTQRLVPLAKRPYVTIQRRGTLSLNTAAFELIGKPGAVELLYDIGEHVIGMRAVDRTAEHAYPVRRAGEHAGSYLVAGTAFTKHYNIDTAVSRRWVADLRDGALCIDLTGVGTEVTSNRRRR